MAAPSGTLWGSTVGSYGRIGLYISVATNNNTTYAGAVQVWFWSKYTVSDTANTLYFDNLSASGSASTSKGSKSITTTVNTGSGWSTTNQVKLAEYSFSYTKGTSAATRYVYAKLTNVDRVGGTMYASTTISVPKLASYTVSYNANGGSGAPSSQTKWYGKSLTLSSTKPTRTGYSFQGWATSSGGSVAYSSGASYTANAAATLYAVWKANTYTVKYNANGGTGAPGNQTKEYGTALKLSTTKPTRTNYNFLGWSTSASATTATYAAGASYTTNAAVTLYAVWELAYTKPKISNLSASRCDTSGTIDDNGTCAYIKFNWSTFVAVPVITIMYAEEGSENWTSATVSASGTSGTVGHLISGGFDVETSYTFRVIVADGTDSQDRYASMSGQAFAVDVLPNNMGVSIGKPAELLKDTNGNDTKAFDVNWLAKMRQHVCVGDKIGHLDGKTGIFLSNEGYMHLQRTTAQGYHPYIGFFLDNDKNESGQAAQIRLNSATNALELIGAESYRIDDRLDLMRVYSAHSDIAYIHTHPTSLAQVGFGVGGGGTNRGLYDYNASRWFLKYDGTDVYIGLQAGEIKPYYAAPNNFSTILRTSGYVTNSGTEVHFTLPLSRSVVGSPAVSATSIDGFILRQDNKYTHGSAASTYVKPQSYNCGICGYGNHIAIIATFSNTTNVVNNSAIGIYASFRITFS